MTSAIQLIETLITPPDCFKLEIVEVEQFIIMGAIIFDQLWKIRNAKIHEAKDADVAIINQQIYSCFKEYWAGRKLKSKTLPSFVHQPIKTSWAAPTLGTIKVNSDVAIGPNFSSIAVVARDWRRNLVLALSKKAKTTIPLQAEAEAILWEIQLAGNNCWPLVIFESDSLICIDALRGKSLNYSWRIFGCISCILLYSETNPGWSFSWTKSTHIRRLKPYKKPKYSKKIHQNTSQQPPHSAEILKLMNSSSLSWRSNCSSAKALNNLFFSLLHSVSHAKNNGNNNNNNNKNIVTI